MPEADEQFTLIVDAKSGRPACTLLQAAFLGPGYSQALYLFEPSTWLTAPTDDMRRFRGPFAEWERIAEKCNAKYASKG